MTTGSAAKYSTPPPPPSKLLYDNEDDIEDEDHYYRLVFTFNGFHMFLFLAMFKHWFVPPSPSHYRPRQEPEAYQGYGRDVVGRYNTDSTDVNDDCYCWRQCQLLRTYECSDNWQLTFVCYNMLWWKAEWKRVACVSLTVHDIIKSYCPRQQWLAYGQVEEGDPAATILTATSQLEHSSGENTKLGHCKEVLGRGLEDEPKESGLCMVTCYM